MLRLFIALWLPPTLKQAALARLEELRRSGKGVRWIRPEQMHLTLKFLGETEEKLVPEIRDALKTAASESRPLALSLSPGGVFPPAGPPRVVWLGMEPGKELKDLAARVEAALQPLGFMAERRPFRPHLTLGRAEPGASFDRDLLARPFTVPAESVTGLSLVRSELRPGGAVYTDVDQWNLG